MIFSLRFDICPLKLFRNPFCFQTSSKRSIFRKVPSLADSTMLQQQAPVCVVSHEKVTVVKVPMDINTFVEDRTSKLANSASVKGLTTQVFPRMPDKYKVNVYHCQGAGENGVNGTRRRSMPVA